MILFFIFLYLYLGVSLRFSYIVFGIIGFLILIILIRNYGKRISVICLIAFGLGVGLSFVKFDFKQEYYSGIVIDSHQNYFILLSKGEKLYTYSKNNEYEIGDYLKIKGKKKSLDFTRIESQFDFEDYLKKKGVNYQLYPDGVVVKFSNPIRIKEKQQKFLSHFNDESKAIIGSMLFSLNDDSEDLTSINRLHLTKFANATGLYIYAFLHFIEFILSYFIKNKRVKYLSLAFLFPYLIFTFPRFTIIRICLIELLKCINDLFLKNKFKHIDLLSISAMFFILVDYHLSYQISFVLGYMTPLFGIFIKDAIIHHKRIRKRIMELCLFYLYFIPFELKFYNGLNPLSLPLQLLLSPLFVVVAIFALVTFYGIPIYGVVDFCYKGISNLLGWLSYASFQINAPPFNEYWILIYVLILLVYFYYKSIDFIPIYKAAIGALLVGLTLYLVPFKNFVSEEVSFINVGQGDACLIRKGTKTMMIDVGGSISFDLAKESLIPYLRKKRIYNIDLVVTTHDDFDHSGSLDSLKKNFYVKNVITEHAKFPLSFAGIIFNNYNNIITSSEDNDGSLVLGFSLCKKDFLIMGDAPIKVEKDIIKTYQHIDCDILKAGHHGSNTSTCDEFVKYLSPKEAIISCGKNNKYGHPHKSVIETLNRNNVKIRSTYIEGTITYSNYIFM